MVKKLIKICITVLFISTLLPAHAVKRYGQNFCHDPDFKCIKVKRGQTWQSLFPDSYERQVVKRLNRMNIRIRSGMTIAVPRHLSSTDLLDISPFPKLIDGLGNKLLVVDPSVLAFAAYDAYGNLVHWGPMSGGKNYCADVSRGCRTVIGKFRIYHKRDSQCKSSKYPIGRGGAPMPYCMFFHGGYALHASTVVPGYHASHGCVRLFKEDAKWLNEEFIDLGRKSGTIVVVNPYH